MYRLLGLVLVIGSLAGCIPKNLGQSGITLSSVPKTIAIAPDDIIRVVTPFAEPRVVTTTSAEIERSQHVLYVLPDDRAPITMFVTDAENEGSSISLTLIPKEGGVREVDVALLDQKAIRDASANGKVVGKGHSAKQPKNKKNEWGKPCRLCRQDDTGNDYGGDNDKW